MVNRQSVLITVVRAFMNRGVLNKYERQFLSFGVIVLRFIVFPMSHFTCIISNITGFGDSLNTMGHSFQLCILLDGKKRKLWVVLFQLYFNWQRDIAFIRSYRSSFYIVSPMSHFTCIISNITGFGDSLNTMEQRFQLCILLDGNKRQLGVV